VVQNTASTVVQNANFAADYDDVSCLK